MLFVYHLGICTEAGRYLYITWVYVRRPGVICISFGYMYGGRALFRSVPGLTDLPRSLDWN